MFTKKIEIAAFEEINKVIKERSKFKNYKLLEKMELKPFFINENIVLNNPCLQDLSDQEYIDIYTKDFNSLMNVIRVNGESGLKKLENLNRELYLKNNKTIFLTAYEFVKYYNKSEEYYNELLLRVTSSKCIFSYIGHEETAILLNSKNDIILAATRGEVTSDSLKRVAYQIRKSSFNRSKKQE